jgi:hypothetical protein
MKNNGYTRVIDVIFIDEVQLIAQLKKTDEKVLLKVNLITATLDSDAATQIIRSVITRFEEENKGYRLIVSGTENELVLLMKKERA